MQRIYPEGWSIEVGTLVHEGSRVSVEVRVPHGDEVFFCAAFYVIEDGMIVRGVELWSDDRPSCAPTWRAHLVKPLPDR